MRMALSAADIDRLYEEDVAYGDLTTRALGLGHSPARLTLSTRDAMRVCGTEDAARILRGAGLSVQVHKRSGSAVAASTPLLSASGTAAELFEIWKIVQTLVEWQSGIATATDRIVRAARAVAPDIVVACTRKNVPLTRRLSVRAVIAGGGTLHRLGLSDSILLFPEHRRFLRLDFPAAVAQLRRAAPERAVVIEVCSEQEARAALAARPDVLQLEKFEPDAVARIRAERENGRAHTLLAAAGGINAANAPAYAAAGADILVTSNPYYAPPCDVAVNLEPFPATSPLAPE
ncbi:MAG: ModD protein [Pseudomonadota bacterium]